MKTSYKIIILLAVAVAAMAAPIHINLQHVRGAAADWLPTVVGAGVSPGIDANRGPVQA